MWWAIPNVADTDSAIEQVRSQDKLLRADIVTLTAEQLGIRIDSDATLLDRREPERRCRIVTAFSCNR